MDLPEKIQELEGIVNALLVQQALSIATEKTLTEMLFGVWRETLAPEQLVILRHNYLFELEEKANETLAALRSQSVVPESTIQRAEFEFFSWLQRTRDSSL